MFIATSTRTSQAPFLPARGRGDTGRHRCVCVSRRRGGVGGHSIWRGQGVAGPVLSLGTRASSRRGRRLTSVASRRRLLFRREGLAQNFLLDEAFSLRGILERLFLSAGHGAGLSPTAGIRSARKTPVGIKSADFRHWEQW